MVFCLPAPLLVPDDNAADLLLRRYFRDDATSPLGVANSGARFDEFSASSRVRHAVRYTNSIFNVDQKFSINALFLVVHYARFPCSGWSRARDASVSSVVWTRVCVAGDPPDLVGGSGVLRDTVGEPVRCRHRRGRSR
jgi:hypothetical protein